MTRIHRSLGVLVVLVGLSHTGAAHGPFCVNDYGDPQRLVVRGCTTFPPDKVTKSLQGDFEVLLAAHPASPIIYYRNTLRDRLLAGYRHSGFPDAEVTARIDREAGKIEITVAEGPRYTAGEIRVTGSRNFPIGALVARLTSPCPPKGTRAEGVYEQNGKTTVRWIDKDGNPTEPGDPVWQAGKPAPFDRTTLSVLEQKIKRAFAELGYFFAVFRVSVVPQPNGKTASLVVDIADEGPKAVLGEIKIDGNKNNSRREILDYLKLKPDMPFTRDQQTTLEHRLWQSGRFIKWHVALEEPELGSDRAALRIELLEFPEAPRLSEPLSPEQKILLKLRDQLADAERWPGDLLATASNSEVSAELVISPNRGILVTLRREAGQSQRSPQPLDLSFVLAKGQAGIFCLAPLHKKFCAAAPRLKLTGEIGFRLNDNLEKADRPLANSFGLGVMYTKEGEGAEPFRLLVHAAPSFFVALPNSGENVECTLEDGVLTLHRSDERYRVDAVSGRLLEYAVMAKPGGAPGPRIRFEEGAFETRLKRIQAGTADCPNEFDANAPVSSLLGFLCEGQLVSCFGDAQPEGLRRLRVLRKLLCNGALEPLGKLLVAMPGSKNRGCPKNDSGFKIPMDPVKLGKLAKKDSPVALFVAALLGCDVLFPRDSWPWTFTRELLLMSVDKAQYTEAELQRLLESDQTGPIFCLLVATLVERVNPRAAKPFAARGLKRLSTADFRKDYRALFDPDHVVGQCLYRMAETVRELGPEEVEVLLEDRSAGEASLLAQCTRLLRSRPDRPIAEVLPGALDAAWETGLRARVQGALEAIRDRKIPGPTGLAITGSP